MGGEGQKPTSFSTVTFTNVRTSPQNFTTFSFDPFAIVLLNVMALPSASPRLLNLNHAHPSKKLVFPVKPLKN